MDNVPLKIIMIDNWELIMINDWEMIMIDTWAIIMIDNWELIMIDNWEITMIDNWEIIMIDNWEIIMIARLVWSFILFSDAIILKLNHHGLCWKVQNRETAVQLNPLILSRKHHLGIAKYVSTLKKFDIET